MIATLKFPSLLKDRLNEDVIASIFSKLLLFAAILFSYSVGKIWQNYHDFEYPKTLINNEAEYRFDKLNKNSTISNYSIISTRNIFGKEPPKKLPALTTPIKESPLKLRLVGVYFNKGEPPFAIIENEEKKEQDIFDLNDMVFSKAKLVKIKEGEVTLKRANESISLVLEDKVSGDSSYKNNEFEEVDGEITVREAELQNALNNLPQLLSQARAIPYFRNGKSIGMRIFAIRKGSMYEKLGLKNGDILKNINSNSLSDPSQALRLFNELKTEKSISVILERAGMDKKLHYSIE